MLKKQAANILSGSRIAAAIFLFFLNSVSNVFLGVYLYCGVSDLIDGPIARRTGSVSVVGATLDTVGDILTYLALAKILLMQRVVPGWVVIWMLGTAVVFAVSGFIALKRFGKFSLVHSLFGKILGISVFLLPFFIRLDLGVMWMAVICTVSSIAAVESVIIQIFSDHLETDVRNIPKLLKEYRQRKAAGTQNTSNQQEEN